MTETTVTDAEMTGWEGQHEPDQLGGDWCIQCMGECAVLRLIAAVREARAQRDFAIAHDRQPYPTAEAYEKACAALHRWQERAKAAEDQNERLRADVVALREAATLVLKVCPSSDDMRLLTVAIGGVSESAKASIATTDKIDAATDALRAILATDSPAAGRVLVDAAKLEALGRVAAVAPVYRLAHPSPALTDALAALDAAGGAS